MKVLVLGGTRFFGIHLVDELLKSNCDVTIATRGLTSDSFGNKVKRIRLDRHDELSIINNLSDKYFDVIYDNLAYCSNDIEILLPHIHCGKYVVTSSTSVYNPLKGDVKETDFDSITYPYINCKRNEVEYAEGKRLVEAAILQKFNDINYICARFPFVIGKDDYTGRLIKYIKCLKKRRISPSNIVKRFLLFHHGHVFVLKQTLESNMLTKTLFFHRNFTYLRIEVYFLILHTNVVFGQKHQ